MPVRSDRPDPLRSRLRDPVFARAYESFLDVVVERASRAVPRRRPRITARDAGTERTTLAS